MTIGRSVTSIGDGAFEGCTSLTNVYYEGTKGELDNIEGMSESGLSSKTITGKDGTTWTAQ